MRFQTVASTGLMLRNLLVPITAGLSVQDQQVGRLPTDCTGYSDVRAHVDRLRTIMTN